MVILSVFWRYFWKPRIVCIGKRRWRMKTAELLRTLLASLIQAVQSFKTLVIWQRKEWSATVSYMKNNLSSPDRPSPPGVIRLVRGTNYHFPVHPSKCPAWLTSVRFSQTQTKWQSIPGLAGKSLFFFFIILGKMVFLLMLKLTLFFSELKTRQLWATTFIIH